jgi:uncharacterized protein
MAAMEAYDADNSTLALHLMEKCAEGGDPLACYTMALWHENGEGTEPDAERRAYWMRRLQNLAEGGDVEAQWDLSARLRWGDLVPLNIERANCWLERAAAGGHGAAQHHLGWYYETGQYDYPVNADAAETWYRRAFAQEHPETLYVFAIKQFKDGVPTDAAIQLLRKAASKGFKQASHVLAAYEH